MIFVIHFSSIAFSQLELPEENIVYEDIQTLFQKIGTYDKMIIQTDLDSLIENKRSRGHQPATILFKGENLPDLSFKTKLKARGKYRRSKCEIPPLKINFSKSELTDIGLFRNFDKLKLVTHCLMDGSINNVVLKEHWVYKMYNNLTTNSFNVNLFTVIYQHDKDLNRQFEGEGFILEPNEEMALRNQGEILDTLGLKNNEVTAQSYHRFLMFNYMIGNTDWKVSIQKNMKFLRKKGSNKIVIVPYDFDNCKLVDAPYMSLYPDAKKVQLDNRYVKQKFWSKAELHQEIDLFTSLKKNPKLHCYTGCDKLLRSEKLAMKSYLKPFFKKIKNKKKMEKLFLN